MSVSASSDEANPPGIDPLEFERHLPHRFFYLATLMATGEGGRLREWGLGVREARVLLTIGRYQPVCATDVADRTGLDKATVSRAMTQLLEAGLIESQADPADRRRSLMHLSARGREANNGIVAGARRRSAQFAQALSTDEHEQLLGLLDKLEAHARTILGNDNA